MQFESTEKALIVLPLYFSSSNLSVGLSNFIWENGIYLPVMHVSLSNLHSHIATENCVNNPQVILVCILIIYLQTLSRK